MSHDLLLVESRGPELACPEHVEESKGKTPLGFGFGRFAYPGCRSASSRRPWALEWNAFGVRLGVAV